MMKTLVVHNDDGSCTVTFHVDWASVAKYMTKDEVEAHKQRLGYNVVYGT